MARIGVISASNSNTTEGDRVINNFVRLYGANAIEIAVNESLANNILVVSLFSSLDSKDLSNSIIDGCRRTWSRNRRASSSWKIPKTKLPISGTGSHH